MHTTVEIDPRRRPPEMGSGTGAPMGLRRDKAGACHLISMQTPPSHLDVRRVDGAEDRPAMTMQLLWYEQEKRGWALAVAPHGAIQVFAFGCEHQYASKKLGNCWHRYTCMNCGHSHEVDSSG